jgi:mannitol/fructose-specific phosphotransferase system IIA component (Ntr-type)
MTGSHPKDISARVPRFRHLLNPNLIVLDVEAPDLLGVCGVLVDHLIDRGDFSESQRAELLDKIGARERVASTAIGGGGVAPHVFVDYAERPMVVMARLATPLDIRTPDGIPADLVFMLVGKREDARGHLETLMQVSRLLGDSVFREEVHAATSVTKVLEAALGVEHRLIAEESPSGALSRAGIETRTGRFAGGLIDDLRRRLPLYGDDFRQGLSLSSVAVTIFLFFACFTGAVTFGALTSASTGGQIGTFEMILVTAVGGLLYALFSGQPLVILGGTGPVLIFTALLYRQCEHMGLPFLPVYAWVGLWAALFTIILAVTDASVFLRYVTRFTDEIFVLLMAGIFIEEAVINLTKEFKSDLLISYSTALSSVVLGCGTLAIAMVLRQFRRGTLLRSWARKFLADFGTVIAIGAMTLLATQMRDFTSLPHITVSTEISVNAVDLMAAPTWVIFAAMVPAGFLAILIFFTQQITGRVINAPQFKLKKGPGYHLDLLVVGVLMGLSSLFGLPWLVAATVRSLNHVSALQTDTVRENRLTGVAIHVLVAASLLLLPFLAYVPMACLYGIFLYMGIVSFSGNQFWERVTLWAMDPALYPATHYLRRVPTRIVHLFTAMQFVSFVGLYTVKVVLGILFPIGVAALVPIRMLMGRFFDDRHLAALDAEETPDEEADREAE